MRLIRWLANIDRRIIFVFICLAIILPLLMPMGLPVKTTDHVENVYRFVDELPAGSTVLMSFDYDPASAPEVHPMALAMLRQCFAKGHKVVIIALWPQGASMAIDALSIVTPEFDVTYGEDYVNLGYKPGGAILIKLMGSSIREAFPADLERRDISEFPIMDNVYNYDDIDFVMSLSAGDPGIPAWVLIAQAQYHVPVAGGCTGVSAPQFFPYLQTEQLLGLLSGLKGAAEYESLLETPGEATVRMDAQSVAHVVIIVFILFANLSFFILRKERSEELETKSTTLE
ncbi:MAG: hypothetical protein JSW52_06575 [Candidatus Coatesbacteria bacterium]|nr:MAG: hypothetical protein JSW52_06575 [Candidatus Coatesbacteria bacterium]